MSRSSNLAPQHGRASTDAPFQPRDLLGEVLATLNVVAADIAFFEFRPPGPSGSSRKSRWSAPSHKAVCGSNTGEARPNDTIPAIHS